MSVEVQAIEHSEHERWNDAIAQAPHATPFHQFEPLKFVADELRSTLHLLAGYKGHEPVGLFPMFSKTIGPLRVVYSPPHQSGITKLGPLRLNFKNLKQRKAERDNTQFLTKCFKWIHDEYTPDDIYIRVVDRYPDLRPFLRSGFDVTPVYTYVVDLSPDKEEILKRFSSDARRHIRQSTDQENVIREGEDEAIARIISQVAARHREQGNTYELSPSYVMALQRELSEGQLRPYECIVDGDFVGGIITLEYNDTVYRWQGGARPSIDFPVNELLDWTIIKTAKDGGFSRYDMVGAMVPQLCKYKAKFAPTPVTVYRIRKQTPKMQLMSSFYRKLPKKIQSFLY